jgi:hypothetical protein
MFFLNKILYANKNSPDSAFTNPFEAVSLRGAGIGARGFVSIAYDHKNEQ